MVAVVTGSGLGLERSSANVLGARGQLGSAALGRANDGVVVNAATGNLVIGNRDELLIGRGPDIAINRTYNSLGQFTDENGDNWATIGSQVVGLTGTLNTAGSYLDRIGWDGGRTRFTYDTSRAAYVSKEGAGAFDTITYNGTNWSWSDGDTGIVEVYGAGYNDRVVSRTDRDGNAITYAYNGANGALFQITTDGGYTTLSWSGNNLTALTTTYWDPATASNKNLLRTRYTYDGYNRLSTVTVDLSPEDSSITDGRVYVTTYTYQGTSKLVASISQTDGSLLQIGYDGSNRVSTLTETVEAGVTRTTSFAYQNGWTAVYDPQGNVTNLIYDSLGQLTRIDEPAAVTGGNRKITDFAYSASGDVSYSCVYDGLSTLVSQDWYRYDGNGNLYDRYQWSDGIFFVTRYYYGSQNQLLTSTTYTGVDPDGHGGAEPTGGMTTRYVYDAEMHLRFKASPEGRITEYRYDAPGNLVAEIDYTLQNVGTAGLSESFSWTEQDYLNWLAYPDKTATQRTDYSYDFRGNLASTTSYARTDTAGTGIFDATASRTYYIYDQAGNLLSKRVDDGSQAETYAYDGMGRTIRFTDAKGVGTWTSYIDNQARTVVTLANGLTQTSAYNKVGELLTFSEARGGFASENLQPDISQWTAGEIATSPSSLAGQAALKVRTNVTQGGWPSVYKTFAATAGDVFVATASLMPTSATTTVQMGIYGVNSGYGNAGTATARIVSGPGRLVQFDGGRFSVEGMIVGQETRVEVTRIFDATQDWAGVFIHPMSVNDWSVGSELIVAAPAILKSRYNEQNSVPSFDLGQFNINNWGHGGATWSSAGTIDGSPAIVYTVQNTGAWTGVWAGFLADAGDTINTAISMMATATSNAASFGIYGDSSSWGYGANSTSTARIVSGPGTLTQEVGGLWNITGLSTSQATRIEITRTFAQRETGTVQFFPDHPNGWIAGHAIIAGAPSITKTPGDLTSYKYDSLGRLRIKTDPAGKRSFFFYDKQGRKIGDVAADGAVAEYKYDAAGRIIATVQYATALSSGQIAGLFDGSGNPTAVEFSSLRPISTASDRWGWTIYDKAGRAVETIDAVGMTTEYVYDGAGRIRYQWKRYNTLSQSQLDGFKTNPPLTGIGPADHANDRITQFYYDGDGLLIGSMDEEMYLTQNIYDAAGRKIESIRYFNRSNPTNRLTDSWTSLLASAGTHAKDEHNYWLYDGIGRVGATIDGEGNVVHRTYDARSNVVREERGRKVTPNTSYTLASLPGWIGQLEVVTSVYDVRGQATSRTQEIATGNVTASFGYDAVGNLTSATDARGYQTTRYYDARGRLVREDVPLDASTVATTRYEYDSRGNVVRTIDARGNASYNYYDERSRLLLQIDAEGYATSTTYTVFGEIASVRRYYTVASGIGSTSTQPTLTTNAKDAVTSFTRDILGRVTSTTDAEGATETYQLDAFGQTYYSTNKLGGGTSYAYTRRGQLYYEYNNQLVVRSDGTTQANNAYKVVNVYDAFGNLVQMVEGNGLTERRDTYYTYDRNNRLIRTDLPQVHAMDGTGADVLVTPYEIYSYDGRGNLIETVDAGGGRTLSYYDDANRRIATIDAVGTHRTYGYDANGNVTVERVYGTATALPGTAGGTPPSPSGTPREILYAYDRSNRLIEKRVPSVQTGQLVGTVYQRPVADLVTTYTYDANGNVIRETDARGNSVLHWYDKLGREIAKVDQENYLTRWDYDSEGNALMEWRYATPISFTPTTTSNPYDLATSVRSDYIDRITTFTYDRMGRRLTELRFYVSAGTISGASATVGLTNSVITYTYNAFGQVLSKTEATGDQTVYQYDGYGRLTRKLDPGFVDHAGANVRRVTDLSYDGLDNLVREVSMEGNTAADAHVTRYTYGVGGRLKSVTDAAGGRHDYQYDAKGAMVRDITPTQRAGGSGVSFWKCWSYDAVGRVKDQWTSTYDDGSGWTGSPGTTNFYDAYGDLVAKQTGGVTQEQMFYDNAGRLVKSSAGDGVWKFFVYDANGNVTLTMTSTAAADIGHWVQSDALANLMGSGALDIASFSQYYTNATLVTYDRRNLATETYEPTRTIANSSNVATTTIQTLNTRKWYNAFGEVVQDRNARGYLTNYSYNTMGRLTQLQAPQTSITLENGGVVSQRPTENYVYDISGRLIATQNANGSWTTRSLLAGSGYGGSEALVTIEYKPDTGVWRTGYDVHGNARKLTDALSRVTLKNYDAVGRLTQVIRPSGFTDSYAYDALGQRIRHWNSQFGSGDAETTDYDMMGRILSQRAFGGDVTSYNYAWNGGLVTAGLGTFGGWVATTTYANAKTSIEKKDYFGRLIETTDLGNHKIGFTYNEAGRMVEYRDITAGPTGGAAWSFTWTTTGRRASVTNAAGTTNFTYDANGNIVYEKLTASGSGNVYKNQTATYDALDRVTDWADAGGVTVPAASLHIEYDANGNVRNRRTTYSNTVGGAQITWVDWFRYDAVDRIVTDKGSLSGAAGASGTTVIRGITYAQTNSYGGTDYVYNLAGDRVGAYHTDNYYYYGRPPGEDYYTSYNVPLQYRTDYQYNADGQQTEVGQQNDSFGFVSGEPSAVTGARVVTTGYTRDASGRVTQQSGGGVTTTLTYNTKGQVTQQSTVSGGVTTTTTNSYTDGSGLYYLGQIVGQTTVQGANTQTTTSSYAWYAGPQKTQTVITGTGAQSAGTSTYTLDAFGQVTGGSTTGGAPGTVSYVKDAAGQGIQTTETFGSSGPYYNNFYRMGGIQMWHYSARFDPRQGDTSGAYTVRGGETMQSIAQSLWGDATLWYKIAEANGFAANTTLTENQKITIPTGVWRVHQNANTYIPYDAGRFAGPGDPQPLYPTAAANNDNGCGVFGQILLAVVAVAVTVATQGTFAAALGGSPVLGGAAAGVAGSIASQVVGVATGIQDEFDWSGVALGALGGAVGGALQGVKLLQGAGSLARIGNEVIRGALGSTLTQGIGVATGLQDRFSWSGVAAAGIGAGVGSFAGGKIGNSLGEFGGRLATSMASGLANAATRSVIDGTDFGDNILAALPDVIGQTVGHLVAQNVGGRAQRGDFQNMPKGVRLASAGGDGGFLTDYVIDPLTEAWSDLTRHVEHQVNDIVVTASPYIESAGSYLSIAFDHITQGLADSFARYGQNQVEMANIQRAGAQAAFDSYRAFNQSYQINTRVGGVVQGAGGIAMMMGGASVGTAGNAVAPGLAAVAGGATFTLGVDQARTGFATALTGRSQQSYLRGTLSTVMSPANAARTEAGILIAAPVGQIAAGASRVAQLGVAAETVTARSLPNQLGQAGELVSAEVTGLPKNTLRIPSASGAKGYRIPDHLEPLDQLYIAETKNVKYQTLTSQILDDVAHVNRSGYPGRVDVIIDSRTTISGPLLREHLNPGSPIKIRTMDFNRR